jgi:hypothetical protein
MEKEGREIQVSKEREIKELVVGSLRIDEEG